MGGGISAENLGAVARFGGGVISCDPDTDTLLVEKLLFGADFSQPAALTVGSADSSRRTFDAVLPVTLPEEPIQTTLVDGRAVALPGQNTVTDPDNGDYVLSTVGFDGKGRFHALVLFDEQFHDLTGDAYPCIPGAEGIDRYPGETEWVKVEHGEDTITTGVTPEQVEYVFVSGSYHGPEEPIPLNVTFLWSSSRWTPGNRNRAGPWAVCRWRKSTCPPEPGGVLPGQPGEQRGPCGAHPEGRHTGTPAHPDRRGGHRGRCRPAL